MRGKQGFINLIAFYNEMTSLMNETRAEGVVYIDFSKGFDSISHNVVIDKLRKYRLDK